MKTWSDTHEDETFVRATTAPKTRSDVRYVKFEPQRPRKDGLLSVKDINQLLGAHDPHHEQGMVDARRWVGETIYAGENSLRALRLGAGITQGELAAAINSSQSHVARIEAGKVDPQTGTIAKIARVLNVDPEVLFRIISRGLTNP
tara:strand:+ start:780 stop:1217 length:438 start_codon:yes stop_codon:yes gene_type:complete